MDIPTDQVCVHYLQIHSLNQQVRSLHQVVMKNSPEDCDLVPPETESAPKMLSTDANVTTDMCNVIQKLSRILVVSIGGCYEYDCMHHLCNVLFLMRRRSSLRN